MFDQTLSQEIEERARIDAGLEPGERVNPDPFAENKILFNN